MTVQGELDLGLTPTAVKVSLVPGGRERALFDLDHASAKRVVAAPRVIKTASRLLYDVLAGVYADLGFDALGDDVFQKT